MDETSSINSIIQIINTIFQNFFSSIDNSLYGTLDKLTFIDSSILNYSIFKKIFGTSNTNGLLLLANSLLFGFAIYYAIRLMYSYYINLSIEKPYQFVFKLIIFGITMNCSYFICKELLEINSFITDAIRSIGTNLLGKEICFSELITQLNKIISINESDFSIFSFDGILKGFISISLFNLIFSYSLRFIMIKVFILLTPFFILSLINNSTSWLFKTWIRTFISLLLQQSLISIILLIIFSINYSSNNVLDKIIFIGGIYALTKTNEYMRSIFGGISTDVSNNLNLASNLLKLK